MPSQDEHRSRERAKEVACWCAPCTGDRAPDKPIGRDLQPGRLEPGQGPARPEGARFAAFLAGYCLIRLVVDFFKPPFGGDLHTALPVSILGHLTAIQWVAALGLLAYLQLYRERSRLSTWQTADVSS